MSQKTPQHACILENRQSLSSPRYNDYTSDDEDYFCICREDKSNNSLFASLFPNFAKETE